MSARAGVVSGALRGAALRDRILSLPIHERDGFVDALLGLDAPPPDDVPDLPRGAVPYLPCGVDEILTMVSEAPLGPADELVDLGSGLGRVAVLAHLLTGARARGIEIQAPLVASARTLCAALALEGVSFEHANAAETELDGSVFFLYAPFNGALLAAVLRRLEEVARRRSIVVCAVDLGLDGVGWLEPRPRTHASLALYDAR